MMPHCVYHNNELIVIQVERGWIIERIWIFKAMLTQRAPGMRKKKIRLFHTYNRSTRLTVSHTAFLQWFGRG